MSQIPYIFSQTQARDREIRNNKFILKKQRPFYFKKFLKNGPAQFPVGQGQCIISNQCKDQFCYSFVPNSQLGFRNITDVIFQLEVKCKRCGATYTYQNIIFDHHLKALLERSFTNQQFKTINRVIILPNLTVQIGRQAEWEPLQNNLNEIRLEKINQIQCLWQSSPQKIFQVDYKKMNAQLKQYNQQLVQQLVNIKKRETLSEETTIEAIQFCLFSMYKGKPIILHYQGDNLNESIKLYKINNFEDIYMVHTTVLVFDKNSRKIFLITFSKELYYSSLNEDQGMIDKFNKSIMFQPIGRCVTSIINGNILNYRAHYYDGKLYIVGGRAGERIVHMVLYCKIKEITQNFSSFNKDSQLLFQKYTELFKNIRKNHKEEGGRFHFSSTIGLLKGRIGQNNKPQKCPYMIIFGGIHKEKEEYLTCKQCSLINLQQQKKEYSYHFTTDYFGMANSTICHLKDKWQNDFIAILGGHRQLGAKFLEKQYKSASIAKIQFDFEPDKQKKLSKKQEVHFSNWQHLQFCQDGAGDANSKKIVFIKKQKNQAFTKVIVDYQVTQQRVNSTATLQTIRP